MEWKTDEDERRGGGRRGGGDVSGSLFEAKPWPFRSLVSFFLPFAILALFFSLPPHTGDHSK